MLQVNVGMVLRTLKENGEKATKLIRRAVALMAQEEWTKTIEELAVGTKFESLKFFLVLYFLEIDLLAKVVKVGGEKADRVHAPASLTS